MDLIHIGIKGRVIAIDRQSGATRWETHLKGSAFTNVTLDGGQLFAATKGELWCLNPSTGEIFWHHGLPGMGYGYVTFASSPDVNLAALRAQINRDQQSQSSAASAS